MEKTAKTKRYIKGSAKEAVFSKDGDVINLSLLVDDLQALLDENPDKHKKGYVQLELRRMKNPDNYGNTHSILENSYTPKAQSNKGEAKLSAKEYIAKAEATEKRTEYKGNVVLADADKSTATDDLPF